jgi:hypothetical protein
MVNKAKRQVARQLIERFAHGEITNRDFEDAFPLDKSDPALAEIYKRLWFFWDDYSTHRLTERYALTAEGRAVFGRCIAFLAQDLEYEWPPYRGASLTLIALRLLRLRKASERRERAELEKLKSFGNLEVWPFTREEDHMRPSST